MLQISNKASASSHLLSMVDFGGATGLQWLVWIQLLVTILLIFLLYCFSLYAFDGDVRVSVSSGDGVGRLLFGREGAATENLSVDTETSFSQSRLKAGENSSIRGEILTSGVSRRIVRIQNGTEGDATSVKDITSNHAVTETHHHHPCSIFKFAREAFLKCLGLDCMAEDSNSRKRE